MTCISWWHHVIHNTIRSTLTPQENRVIPASQITQIAKILYYDIYNTDKGWKLAPHVDELIPKLAHYRDKENGPQLAIISNFDNRLEHILSGILRVITNAMSNFALEMKIDHLFDAIVVSYDVKCEKPQRQIFDECKRRLQITSNDIMHVGNSLKHDVHGACDLNWMAVHYNPNGSLPESVTREAADAQEDVYICHEGDKKWLEVKCLSKVAKLVIA